MKAYTRDQINEINSRIDKAIEDRNTDVLIPLELIKDWMIAKGHRKQDKPFGKPYKHTTGMIMIFADEQMAFGFNNFGNWFSRNDFTEFFTDSWQPYPQEKWEAMLLDYAKKNYRSENHKCLIKHNGFCPKNPSFRIMNGNVWISFSHGENKIFDGKTGVWAEIIEEQEVSEQKSSLVQNQDHLDLINSMRTPIEIEWAKSAPTQVVRIGSIVDSIDLLRTLPESVQLVIVNAMSDEKKVQLIGM